MKREREREERDLRIGERRRWGGVGRRRSRRTATRRKPARPPPPPHGVPCPLLSGQPQPSRGAEDGRRGVRVCRDRELWGGGIPRRSRSFVGGVGRAVGNRNGSRAARRKPARPLLETQVATSSAPGAQGALRDWYEQQEEGRDLLPLFGVPPLSLRLLPAKAAAAASALDDAGRAGGGDVPPPTQNAPTPTLSRLVKRDVRRLTSS
jgi:hypothetical protein